MERYAVLFFRRKWGYSKGLCWVQHCLPLTSTVSLRDQACKAGYHIDNTCTNVFRNAVGLVFVVPNRDVVRKNASWFPRIWVRVPPSI